MSEYRHVSAKAPATVYGRSRTNSIANHTTEEKKCLAKAGESLSFEGERGTSRKRARDDEGVNDRASKRRFVIQVRNVSCPTKSHYDGYHRTNCKGGKRLICHDNIAAMSGFSIR